MKTVKRRTRATPEEMKEAREKMNNLEEQITFQKTTMAEHQEKMMMLEQLIKRQCLVLKENDDKCTYEQHAKAAPGKTICSVTCLILSVRVNVCEFRKVIMHK